MAGKRLQRAFNMHLPNGIEAKDIFLQKASGVLKYQWVDLAKVEVGRREDEIKVLFNKTLCEAKGFDKDAIRYSFENCSLSSSSVETVWCP
eukprot:11581564-Karenia_brevis.AAC.1